MMSLVRRIWCWLGFHSFRWLMFSHTCELWVCACGHIRMQFSDDPRALSEVQWLDEQWKKSEGNHVGR